MGYGISLEIWGEYALFTRPEMKAERVSYDVITPSAARGILEAIFWHPGMRWEIDRIHVMNPIKFTNIRRNEVTSVVSASCVRAMMNGGAAPYISTADDIMQRASLLLKEVRYVIDAHFELTMPPDKEMSEEKFYNMAKRRMEKGQCYHQPCFGCREFPAHFKLNEVGVPETAYTDETRDLGIMLYDMDYSNKENITPIFFRAIMKDGVISPRNCEVYR